MHPVSSMSSLGRDYSWRYVTVRFIPTQFTQSELVKTSIAYPYWWQSL